MTRDDFYKADKTMAELDRVPADKRIIFQSFAVGFECGLAAAKNDANAPKPTGEKTA